MKLVQHPFQSRRSKLILAINIVAFPLAFVLWLLLRKHIEKPLQLFYWYLAATALELAFLTVDAVRNRRRPCPVCSQHLQPGRLDFQCPQCGALLEQDSKGSC